MPVLTIPSRFRGPSGSGNGGYVCGCAAAYVAAPATVTLRRPPPLDTALTVEQDGNGSVRVRDSAMLIAEAQPAPDAPDREIPGPVSPAEARAAAGRARYFQDPVFPDCFVCGPARLPCDGLRIFPGPVAGRELWAAPWTPDSRWPARRPGADLYARSLAAQGHPDDVAAVIAANPRPSPRCATIPPQARAVLDQLAACGTGAEVREQVGRWDHAVDVVTILLPPDMPWSSVEATLRAAAPGQEAEDSARVIRAEQEGQRATSLRASHRQ
jgi:hypothetical protein